MTITWQTQLFKKLVRSRKAIAIPATFMILFVSTLGIISVTYYFSVERVNAQSQTLKISTAKQDLLALDETILATLWQPGSARTMEISDSGGLTNIQPTSNVLTISVSDGLGIEETIFNASTGKVSYELPYTRSLDIGLYLKGDSRTITNQSGSSLTQLYIANGVEHPEIQLHYRPTVSYTAAGLENGKAVNYIRIYIVSLNSSDAMALRGKLPLKISCQSTQFATSTYDVSYQLENFTLTSTLDGRTGAATVPISSTAEGAVIHVETVISNVAIERWIR